VLIHSSALLPANKDAHLRGSNEFVQPPDSNDLGIKIDLSHLGCVLINPALKALVAECPLRSESDRNTALPRYDAMCQSRPNAPQQKHRYSITASARAMSIGGTSRPSALALRRLMINSKCVGCSTGRSEGLLPLRILSTKYAHRTNELGKLGP
jgi:hypothetical protein